MSALGTDLAVVPDLVAYDAAAKDLVIRATLAPRASEMTDLATIAERRNLAQALVLRLLTPRGTLAPLGHAAYGSRLHELIGQAKIPATRNLCRAFVLEVVAQEPRVESTAVDVVFDPLQESPDSFVFTLAVQPRVGSGDPLAISLEVAL
jgi:phage baseplate assembly protein W